MDLTSEDGGNSQGLIEFDDEFESNQGFLSHDFGGVFSDDDMPDMEYDTNNGPNAHNREMGYTKCEENFPSICFRPGERMVEGNEPRVFDNTDGPNGDDIEINQKSLEDVYVLPRVVAFAASTVSSSNCAWDLYNSGASHHMSPC
jgi:hypothetical protein